MCLYTWEKGGAWDGGGGRDSLGASHGPINCGQGGGVNTIPAPPIPLAPPTSPAHPQLQHQHGLSHKSPRDRQEEVLGKYGRMVLLVSIPLPPRPSLPADRQRKGERKHIIAKNLGLDWQRGKANTPGFVRGQTGNKNT